MTRVLISVISFLTALVFLFGLGLAGYTYWKALSPWYYGVSALCLLCFLFGLMDVVMLRRKVSAKVQAKTQQKIAQEAEKLAAEKTAKAADSAAAAAASAAQAVPAMQAAPSAQTYDATAADAPSNDDSACGDVPDISVPGEQSEAAAAPADTGSEGGFFSKFKSMFT